jgi:hypothetical protein
MCLIQKNNLMVNIVILKIIINSFSYYAYFLDKIFLKETSIIGKMGWAVNSIVINF